MMCIILTKQLIKLKTYYYLSGTNITIPVFYRYYRYEGAFIDLRYINIRET